MILLKQLLETNFWSLLTYLSLVCTILLTWYRRIPLWLISYVLAIMLAYVSEHITILGVIEITILSVNAYLINSVRSNFLQIQIIYIATFFILGLALMLHVLPGFNNWKVLSNQVISKGALPVNIYLNFDKACVGILLIGWIVPTLNLGLWFSSFIRALPVIIVTITVLTLIALYSGFVQWDFKWPSFAWIWIINNLFLVCVSEEAFFRGLVQVKLSKWLSGNMAILISASIFGIVLHYRGGLFYSLLAVVAGIGYGFVYNKTKSIEITIITHFLVNLFHFSLLTYPALIA